MTHLYAASGRSLQLNVISYQYGQPEFIHVEDDNWLVIEIQVVAGSRRWHAREPALMTWELAELVAWLRNVSGGTGTNGEFEATEPNLSFTAVRDGEAIRLNALFRLEFAHPDLDYDDRVTGHAVEFVLSPEDLRQFADELETEGSRFPVRSQPG